MFFLSDPIQYMGIYKGKVEVYAGPTFWVGILSYSKDYRGRVAPGIGKAILHHNLFPLNTQHLLISTCGMCQLSTHKNLMQMYGKA